MHKILKLVVLIVASSSLLSGGDVMAALTGAKKQSAIQFGTKVRTKVEATGIYDTACYDKYFSCMDQFCIVDNELGGSCNCSDDIFQYETALEEIKKITAEAERISVEEVEKVKAGANADIIFNGTRIYDENNNVIATRATKDKTEAKMSVWSSFYGEEDEDMDIANKSGEELYLAAQELCEREIKADCAKDLDLLTQIYSRQIVSDCKGLANGIEQKRQEAKSQLAAANASVRAALKESLEESNKYDRGTCMVEYKKCMRGEDACGSDWENCVDAIASDNMQNKNTDTQNTKLRINATAATKAKEKENEYGITPSTLERLESKRLICERVLDSCVAVRNYVWNDFLKDITPTIKYAEQNIESKKRQSCLMDISDCIHKACKDDIAAKGLATMDACLARPGMARSFCKIQLEPCERMEPQIWDYVESKLVAMRVDACTQEVKDCLTAEDRCGADYSNCIGMDFDYIHKLCPIDKLVVCKQARGKDFQMDELDDMLMGLFLNIDNKALDNCEKVAEEKMLELCGSTTDCNLFAADDYIGTSSIKSQKDGGIYRVTGMISFGSIKMGDAAGNTKDGRKKLLPGEIGVKDYITEVRNKNSYVPDSESIISSIEEELNNIAGTINKTIALIESDPRVQYCINGRDLNQINGKKSHGRSNVTVARFPNLLNQYRVMIGMSALRKAQDNYNNKVSTAIEEAARNASLDLAQYLCQKTADLKNRTINDNEIIDSTPLTPPYAISYEVGSGIDTKTLASMSTTGSDKDKDWDESNSVTGSKTNRTAIFDRSTRICHVCTTVTTKECKESTNKSAIWKLNHSCKADTTDPVCEDIRM